MLLDQFNCELFDNVRPIKWNDPEPGNYDIVVIGGGAGGLVTAAGSAGLGAKVCLIERNFLGGDCLVNGCVPSKAFLKACKVAHTVKNCSQYGIKVTGEVEIDFEALMNRMKEIRAKISKNDAAKRFTDHYGIDVFLGHAKFTDKKVIEVNEQKIQFNKAVIATGARPNIP